MRRFIPKRRLKQNVKVFLMIIMLIPILHYMHKNPFLKYLFNKSASNYVSHNIFQ